VTRVLVTGGAGFIGSHVAETLLSCGSDVLVLDNLASGSRQKVPAGCDLVVADITDADGTAEAAMRFLPEVIVHLAAQTNVEYSVAHPGQDASVNIMGTLAVLEAMAKSRCRKVIFASSSTVYGDPARQPVVESDPIRPISPYGASKAAGEQYVRIIARERRLHYTILRLGNVFGPRDSLGSGHAVTAFVDALLSGRTPAIEWDGEQTKDYVYVGDVADAVVAALDRGDNETFNIASEVGISVNNLYHRICVVMGTHPAPRHRERRSGDVRTFVMSCAKARRLLGWHAHTPLPKALEMTVEAMARAHQHNDDHVRSAAG
jgi:UDP-glucose 4-epimerase